MIKIIPPKLQSGDTIRVIAPSRSLSIVSKQLIDIAGHKFNKLGLHITFGEHVNEKDSFFSSSIESRIADLHTAFADKNVKAILTVIGGFNSNQLLDYLNWDLIKDNPKIFCGYSDITVLNNAFFAKVGLVTYSGPHYSTFGQEFYFDYTLDYFKKCLMNNKPFEIIPSHEWTDDEWYRNQKKRDLIINDGPWIFNEGQAQGTILGGNLGTLNLLQGTQYMPDLKGSILFLEDDSESQPHHFDRDLQSLTHLKNFVGVKGLIIGMFQKKSGITFHLLKQIVKSKKVLDTIPIIGNINFGHTDPKITFPVGGTATLQATKNGASIKIIDH